MTSASAADGHVSGSVVDGSTRSGMPGAEITVSGSPLKAVTAPDGSFSLDLPPGTYELTSNYLGYPNQTVTVVVPDGGSVPAMFSLAASDVVVLDVVTVKSVREGQARAVNQQRTSQNLTSIISSDLSGQFPDKTIADAVKRLPGITVETDTDTGGSEGRYITIRGMNADFNAVSVNGMRVAVSDFGGLSRRVPLDVVSAKSADQIEVTKALRPDQDGDGIGGYVNIVTRSPFDRNGSYAFAEGSVGRSALSNDYTGSYPHSNPSYEASAGYSATFGAKNDFGIFVSGNFRDKAFAKQRVSTQGWAANGGPGGTYYPIGVSLQDFFDDVKASGFNGTLEWRPSENNRIRFDVSFSNRDTERGRQRLVRGYIDGGTGTAVEGSYASYTASGRVSRNIRQFFEDQRIVNLILRGDTAVGAWKLNYFAGYNSGTFDGNAAKDINATFRTSSMSKTFTADGYTPGVRGTTYEARVNDPSRYYLNTLDRGTSFVDDKEFAAGLDAKRKWDLSGGTGYVKGGFKTRLFDRDYDRRERRIRFIDPDTNNWALDGFEDVSAVGSSVADYSDPLIVNDTYNFGPYLNPEVVRHYADYLEKSVSGGGAGLLESFPDNALRSQAASYKAKENIFAGYVMSQQNWGRLSALVGARIEFTKVNFKGFDAKTSGSTGLVKTVTPYDRSNDYVNVLPGAHLRYAQNKNLIYRFSVTRSIARPQLSDINPSILQDPYGEDAFSRPDGYVATLDRGDINLKPTTSTNVDLGLEYYFDSASSLTAGLFYKDMRNNAYRGYNFNDPAFPDTLVRTSLNAKSSWVRGIELGYDQQLTFLPSPFNGLGAFANYTYVDSEVDVGLPQYANVKLPLFNQVKNTINAGLFFEKHGFRARAALLYRSESLLGLSIDEDFRDYDPALSRYVAPSTSLDITASYRFMKSWQAFVEFQNVLDTPGRAYDGAKSRMDYNEYSGYSANIGLRWTL